MRGSTEMIGQRISHYEIIEKLGEGGMGVVYKARDERLGRFVAVKVLAPDKVADPERKRRFMQEARAASALNHPNIVTVHEIDRQDGIDFLVMEYLPGQTLNTAIPRHGMRLKEALNCAVQIADALEKAHAAGIVHRDLKPQNVMVAEDGRVKVLDFGLAKLTDPVASGEVTATETLDRDRDAETREGTVLGTAAYMSPEQAEGKHIDSRSDIFSFGAMLYEMFTGKRAFQRDSRISTLAAILRDEQEPPSQLRSDLPPDLERTIVRCLRKDPAHRYQHAGDVRIALEEISEAMTAPRARIARLSSPRRWWILGPVLVCLAAAAAIAVWRYVSAGRAPQGQMIAEPLTSYPGDEDYPSFSPDGNQIVFAWSMTGEAAGRPDLYVKLVGPGSPLRLTSNPAAEWNPVWSPDGRTIAFLRATATDKADLLLIPALGGAERKLSEVFTPFNRLPSISWLPDGKWLVVHDRPSAKASGALFLLSVETGEKRRLTSPPEKAEGDLAPAVSPDGRKLAFSRTILTTVSDVFLLDLTEKLEPAGEPRRLSALAGYMSCPAWTADGRHIVFVSGQWGDMALWRVKASDPAPRPERVPYIGEDAYAVAIARQGNRLAYKKEMLDLNIWRLALRGSAGTRTQAASDAPLAMPLISSSRMDHTPAYSSDGNRIAFSTNQSGSWEIWLCQADGSSPAQLTSMKTRLTRYPSWSPDGKWIVFDSRPEGHADLFVISPEGGTPRRLTSDSSNDYEPSWSPDGRWIYFSSNRSGDYEIWRMSPAGGESAQVSHQGGRRPVPSPDGRSLYYARREVLVRLPLEGGKEEVIAENVNTHQFSAGPGGVFFAARLGGENAARIYRYDPATGRREALYTPSAPLSYGFNVSRDGTYLLFTQIDHRTADLMLVENFR